MSKKITILLVFLLVFSSVSFAQKTIDVGIFYKKLAPDWVRLQTDSNFVLRSENSSFGQLMLQGINDITIKENKFYQIVISENSQNAQIVSKLLEKLKAENSAMADSLYICYDRGFRIAYGNFSSHEEASAAAGSEDFANLIKSNGLSTWVNSPQKTVVAYQNSRSVILISSLDSSWSVDSEITRLTCSSLGEKVRRYRGGMRIFWADDSSMSLINRVDLEDYICGVVANEMNYTWGVEALKTQAVASRGYAFSQLGSKNKYDIDVDDTTSSQVYLGYDSERPQAVEAVRATEGECLIYGGEIVPLYYHASSGGSVDSSVDIWSGNKGYLKQKVDVFSLGMGHENWNYLISADSVALAMQKNGSPVGIVSSIEILSRTPGGRVKKMRINGSEKTTEISGSRFRYLLGSTKFKSTLFSFNINTQKSIFGNNYSLVLNARDSATPSTATNTSNSAPKASGIRKLSDILNYEVSDNPPYIVNANSEQEISNNEEDIKNMINLPDFSKYIDMPATEIAVFSNGSLTIYGHGYGHGVGMSQVGVKKMADMGYDYKTILDFYYSGVGFKNIYENN